VIPRNGRNGVHALVRGKNCTPTKKEPEFRGPGFGPHLERSRVVRGHLLHFQLWHHEKSVLNPRCHEPPGTIHAARYAVTGVAVAEAPMTIMSLRGIA